MRTADEILAAVAAYSGFPLEKLLDNNDPTVARPRLLAAPLLSELWGDEDEGRVQHKLNCTLAHVRLANKLAGEEGEEGTRFREELRKIQGDEPAPKEPAAPASEAPSDEVKTDDAAANIDPELFLFHIGKERYGFEPDELFKGQNGQKVAHARSMMIYLASAVYLMKSETIAKMMRCELETAQRVVRNTSYDFAYDLKFEREVRDVAKQFGISLTGNKTQRSA